MSIVRYSPSRSEISPFWMGEFTPVSRLVEELFNPTRKNANTMFWGPNVDIVENDEGYEIHAELPGIKQEDVKLTLNNNVLTITGEKKQNAREDKDNVLRVERTYGRFERSFTLPRTVKADQVQAEFEDGVLIVKLPKAEEAKARTINIDVKQQVK